MIQDHLEQEKGGKLWFVPLLGIVVFAAGIFEVGEGGGWAFFGIISLLAGVLWFGLGIAGISKKASTKASLRSEIADCQKKMAILKNIPTFEEYSKAHGIDSE